MSLTNLLLMVFCASLLAGCTSMKSYVDPAFAKATYDDIKPVRKKYTSNILIEFQSNDEHISRMDNELRRHVERTLMATGIILPGDSSSKYTIKVVLDNIVDAKVLSDALVKLFNDDEWFVTDYYEATIEFTDESGNKHVGSYKHALLSTTSNNKAPFKDVQPTTPADGFGTVVEQMLLNFIKEMQEKGILTFNTFWNRIYS